MERAGMMRFDFDSESWAMSWANPDGRSSSGRVEINGPKEALVTGANSAYLLDGLAVAAPAATKTTMGLSSALQTVPDANRASALSASRMRSRWRGSNMTTTGK